MRVVLLLQRRPILDILGQFYRQIVEAYFLFPYFLIIAVAEGVDEFFVLILLNFQSLLRVRSKEPLLVGDVPPSHHLLDAGLEPLNLILQPVIDFLGLDLKASRRTHFLLHQPLEAVFLLPGVMQHLLSVDSLQVW